MSASGHAKAQRHLPRERRSGERIFASAIVGGVKTACISRQQMGRLMVGDCLAARGGKRAPKLVFAASVPATL